MRKMFPCEQDFRKSKYTMRMARMSSVSSREILESQLLPIFGVEELSSKWTDFANEDEAFLATPFHAENAAAAVIAAVSLAGAQLDGANKITKIKVDRKLASAAIRQDRYMLRNSAPIKVWDDISGMYTARDGRTIQFHCNFPHHRQKVLEVLNLPREGVNKKATQARVSEIANAFDLEEAINEAGGCAAVVRSMEEWHEHEQYQAIKGLPLIEVLRFEHNVLEMPTRLSNDRLRCLDFSRIVAGPMAGRTLADFGADVLRVSSPNLPFIESIALMSGFGKRSAFLDLGAEEDMLRLKKLLPKANALLNAYRPCSLDRFGMNSEALAQENPGLIIGEISAFGSEGPWKNRRGFDSLTQCVTGLVHEHSRAMEFEALAHLPVQLLDYVSGYLTAFGIMMARQEQLKTQKSTSFIIRLSLARVSIWLENLGRKSPVFKNAENIPVAEIAQHMKVVETGDGSMLSILDVPFKFEGKEIAKLGHAPPTHGSSEAGFLP